MLVVPYSKLSEENAKRMHIATAIVTLISLITFVFLIIHRIQYDAKWSQNNNYVPNKYEEFSHNKRGQSLLIITGVLVVFGLIYISNFAYAQYKLTELCNPIMKK